MGLRVNTNVASLNARRHLYDNTMRFNKSLERLSSGLRINRSGDDAAGLAISEGLKSDIRALEQALLACRDAANAEEFDCAATDIRNALHFLGSITGTDVDATVLERIFERFCVGK